MKKRNAYTRILAHALVVLAVSAAGCSKDDDPVGPSPCSGTVTLTAGSGLAPQFSWTPNCTAAGLFVQRVADGASMWSVSTTGTPLRSPVVYGTLPGTATGTTAAPLVTGVQYRVGLVSSDGGGIATIIFTP